MCKLKVEDQIVVTKGADHTICPSLTEEVPLAAAREKPLEKQRKVEL